MEPSSNCDFELLEGTTADYRCRREGCGLTVRNVRLLPLYSRCQAMPQPELPKPRPLTGPGAELEGILKSLALNFDCSLCGWRATAMDHWGVEGCREHFEEIVGWLRESYEKLGWRDTFKAMANAALSGLALEIDPRDPPRSLAELAIRRAEERADK